MSALLFPFSHYNRNTPKYLGFKVILKNILISVVYTSKEINTPQLVFYMLHYFVKVKSYCKVDVIKKKKKKNKKF